VIEPVPVDLVVLGDINPDVIVSDDDPEPIFGDVEKRVDGASLHVGGSSAICACGAARIGLNTVLVGVVGDDLLGRLVLDEIAAREVDIRHCVVDPGVATGATVVLARERDRAMLTYPGGIEKLSVGHVPHELLRNARHLHVGSYFLWGEARDELPALFSQAAAVGVSTSVDCNWDPTERWGTDLLELLDIADVFFCNAREAGRITGHSDVKKAGAELARHARVAVIKEGARGALAVHGEVVAAVGAPEIKAVDPVGAGDSFDAGFLCRWIAGEPLLDCLRFGVACGSLATHAVGGTGSQPTAAQAAAIADGLPVRA
jgi:sugar/nucleoside kinase (ribokinase family)